MYEGSWEAKSQSHSMAKYLKLAGTSGDHLVQPLLQQHQLQQVDKAYVMSDFEYLQGWRLHHLSGQPVPVLDHPPQKNVFLLFSYVLNEISCVSICEVSPQCLRGCLIGGSVLVPAGEG